MANSLESAITLANAIKSGNLPAVRVLVECLNLDCHAVYAGPENIFRATFLHMAVCSKRADVVKYLIEERGVNVDQRLSDGKTSLHIAAGGGGGCFEIAKLLVNNGADCNAMDKIGYSPCHYAAGKEDAKVIVFLVKHGKADINIQANIGITPFHVAAKKINNSSFLKLLIDLGADFTACDSDGQSALHYAGMYGHVSTVKFLIEEKHLDPNQRDDGGRNLLYFVFFSEEQTEAVTKGKAEIVEYLVKEGKINVNKVMDEGVAPLHVACGCRNLNIVKFLIDKGADCNLSDNEGNSPLHCSVLLGSVDIVRYLIEQTNVNVNERNLKGETPLHSACMAGELDYVTLLLDNEADINAVDDLGRYCLHFATIKDRANIVKYLVEEKRFDVNRGTNEAATSLHLAASCGHLEICKLLVKLGADYTLRDKKGNSVLHYATMEGLNGNVNILEYFIKELGQDANKCINEYGNSPLHLACYKDDLASVKFLLENGADYKLLDNDGKDCLKYAASAPGLQVYRYLVGGKNLEREVRVRNTFGTTPLERMMIQNWTAANSNDCHIS